MGERHWRAPLRAPSKEGARDGRSWHRVSWKLDDIRASRGIDATRIYRGSRDLNVGRCAGRFILEVEIDVGALRAVSADAVLAEGHPVVGRRATVSVKGS